MATQSKYCRTIVGRTDSQYYMFSAKIKNKKAKKGKLVKYISPEKIQLYSKTKDQTISLKKELMPQLLNRA
jgi:hypothetical protein